MTYEDDVEAVRNELGWSAAFERIVRDRAEQHETVENLAKRLRRIDKQVSKAWEDLPGLPPLAPGEAARQREKKLREADEWLAENRGLVVGQNSDGVGMREAEGEAP